MNAGTRDGSHRHGPLTIGNQFLFFLYIEPRSSSTEESIAEVESEAIDDSGGKRFVTVEFAREVLTRLPLSPAQSAVLKALYDAGAEEYVTTTELVRALGYGSGHQLAGVMGAFGRRIANTKGFDENATFFEMRWNETAAAWEYRLPANVRKALEQEGLV